MRWSDTPGPEARKGSRLSSNHRASTTHVRTDVDEVELESKNNRMHRNVDGGHQRVLTL